MSYILRFTKNEPYGFVMTYKEKINGVLTPINLTGKAVTMKLTSGATDVVSLTEGSGITVSDLEGKITIALTASQTNRTEKLLKYRVKVDSTTILKGWVFAYD